MKYAFGDHETGLITITYSEKGSNIEIVFADNGTGLPADFSVNEAESLGFSLIMSLVMQLNGKIIVENKNGAVFTITLPRLNAI